MKTNLKHITKTLAALTAMAASGTLLTGCDDFLSIVPQNEIVLENYWTEEADVNSVLYSCYTRLASDECLKRMIVWGELRSDNMTTGSGAPYNVQQTVKGNLLETNEYTQWQCFYEVINRCNTVLRYAPEVNAIDPNFTDSELRATVAEATTLRALSYFYLIRAFRDVPYVTEPSSDDDQDYQTPATPFDQVLANIIADVESVKNDAVRSYGEKSVDNTTRVTRWLCNALLADMYLWQGDWQKCVECCDAVIAEKTRQYEEEYEENPTTLTTELYGVYPLISESLSGSSYGGNSYNEIFGKGNSFESIFELNFPTSANDVTNKAVGDFYGSGSGVRYGQIGVPTFIYENVFTGTNKYFAKTDSRYLSNMTESSGKIFITKYVNQSVSFRTSTTTGGAPTVTASTRSSNHANWIIYRLSDVILMRAEAEIELAGNVETGTTLSAEQQAHYQAAYDAITAVWRRGNNMRSAATGVPRIEDYNSSRVDMENFLMDERQREFMFEGKRWFDLVRISRRDNDNTRLLQKVLPKFQENTAAIRVKMATQDALYWPYNRDELKQNPNLTQNPAYETDNTQQNR